jgi:hypothetical protein
MQQLTWTESLAAGEIRTIALTLTPDTPASATYTVHTADGRTLVASTAATVNGSVISCLLTIPANTGGPIFVLFTYVVGSESIQQRVQVNLTL